jgi:hypothetical protein
MFPLAKYAEGTRSGDKMSRQSIVLLKNPGPVVVFQGEPVRVDSWYTDVSAHQHTLSIATSHCRGRLTIEASVKLTPSNSDWFPIKLGDQLFIDYPRNGLHSETSTIAFSFTGRFIWMRARIDRSLIIPLDAQAHMVAHCGLVDRILLNV